MVIGPDDSFTIKDEFFSTDVDLDDILSYGIHENWEDFVLLQLRNRVSDFDKKSREEQKEMHQMVVEIERDATLVNINSVLESMLDKIATLEDKIIILYHQAKTNNTSQNTMEGGNKQT